MEDAISYVHAHVEFHVGFNDIVIFPRAGALSETGRLPDRYVYPGQYHEA
jgi:hypothetical protein